MKRRSRVLSRLLAAFLAVLMLVSALPVQALAASMPEGSGQLDESLIAAGSFYLDSETITLEENGQGLLLRVARKADETLPAQSVRLVMTDMTANYGVDYVAAEYQGPGRTEAENPRSMLELIAFYADELEEYNDSDTLIDTGLLPNSEPAEQEALSQEEALALADVMNAILYGEDDSPVLDDALRQDKELYTGVPSDRTDASGSQTKDANAVMAEILNDILGSAGLVLTFGLGETEKFVLLTPIDNDRAEGDRLTTLTLFAESETACISDYAGAALTIRDDEEAPVAVVSLSAAEYRPEDGYVRAVVQRTGAENQTVSVCLTTRAGTAVEGRDYSGVEMEVEFPFGVMERHVNIPVCSDALTEAADFFLELSGGTGAVPGAVQTACVTIQPRDDSFRAAELQTKAREETQALLGAAPQIRLGESVSGIKNVYGIRTDDGSVKEDEGDVRLFADKCGLFYAATSWAGCYLVPDLYAAQLSYDTSVFYEGIRIHEDMCSDADDDDRLKFRADVTDREGQTKKQWEKSMDAENLNKNENANDHVVDIYFPEARSSDRLYVEMFRDDQGTRNCHIQWWAPILRPFTVQLMAAQPLEFINSAGQRVPNTQIGNLSYANQALMEDALNGKTATRYLGDTITVSRQEDSHPVSRLTGLELVNPDGSESWPLVSAAGPDGGTTLSYPMTFENPALEQFALAVESGMTCGTSTRRDTISSGTTTVYDYTCYLRPTMTYYDCVVKVYQDAQGRCSVTPEDAALAAKTETGSDAYGSYTAYTFHQGDYIRLRETVSEAAAGAWKANAVTLSFHDANGWTPERDYHNETQGANKGLVTFQSYYDEIRVFPKVDLKENAVRVQVPTRELGQFRTDAGFLADAPRETSGGYTVFTLVSPEDFASGVWYEFSAFCTDPGRLPLWTLADGTVCGQNTLYYYGAGDAAENLLTLSTVRADALPAAVQAQAFCDLPEVGGGDTVTVPAADAILMLGVDAFGLADESGSVTTGTFAAAPGTTLILKAVYGGREEYLRLALPEQFTAVTGSYTDLAGDPVSAAQLVGLQPIRFSGRDDSCAGLSSVTALTQEGDTSSYVAIDGKKHTFLAFESSPAPTYTYTDENGAVQTATEQIIGVSFLVMRNGVITETQPASKTGSGLWSAAMVPYSDYAAQYDAGDRIYVQITTDRRVGSGKALVDGVWVEQEALCRTVYEPQPTKLYFTAGEPAEQQPQEIPIPQLPDLVDAAEGTGDKPVLKSASLPFLNRLGATFNLGPVRIQLSALDYLGRRKLSFGTSANAISNIVNKDENGNRKPENNPDLAKLKEFTGGTKILGRTFGVVGGFLSKPKWDVAFGFYLYLVPLDPADGLSEYTCVGGGLFAAVSLVWRGAYYFMIFSVPVYFGFDISATLLMGCRLDCNLPDGYIDPFAFLTTSGILAQVLEVPLETTIMVVAEAYAGIGVCKVLGVRGGLSAMVRFMSDPSILNEYKNEEETEKYTNPYGLQLMLSAKVWLDLMLQTFDYYWVLKLKNYGYFDEIAKARVKLTAPEQEESVETGYSDKQLPEGDPEWLSIASIQAGPGGGATGYVLQENGYDRADPQLLDMGEGLGTLLVYVDKRAEAETTPVSDARLDATVLKFSVFNGSGWSEPQVIQTDGTADYMPNLCDAGDHVLISWVSRDPEADISEKNYSMTDYMADLDVYTVLVEKQALADGEAPAPADVMKLTRDTGADDYYYAAPQAVYVETEPAGGLRLRAASDDGTCMVFYQKSLVTSGKTVLQSFNPLSNNCEVAYMMLDVKNGELELDTEYEEIPEASRRVALKQALGGERFLYSPLADQGKSDPLQDDLDVIAFEHYVIYAFSVDADGRYTTEEETNDRQLYVQVYDAAARKTYDPVPVCVCNEAQALPQLLVRKTIQDEADYAETPDAMLVAQEYENEPLLFWLEGGQAVRYTSLLGYIRGAIEEDPGYDPDIDDTGWFSDNGVFFGAMDPAQSPNLNTYVACTDYEGNLYVTWTQSVYQLNDETGQMTMKGVEIFASALIDGNDNEGTAWSDGVQLTFTDKLNDEQCITVDHHGNIIVVNNQMDLDVLCLDLAEEGVSNKPYAPTDLCMVATVKNAGCTLQLTELNVSDETPMPGDTVTVTGRVKNAGLLRADDYGVVISAEGQTLYEDLAADRLNEAGQPVDQNLVPSGEVPFRFTMTVPAGGLPALDFAFTGSGSTRKDQQAPFRAEAHYAVSEPTVTVRDGQLYLSCRVTNDGNAPGSGAVLKAAQNNLFFDDDPVEEAYLTYPLDALQPGETAELTDLPLWIPEKGFTAGIAYSYAFVEENGVQQSNDALFDAALLTKAAPVRYEYQLEDVPEEGLSLQAGDTRPLSVTSQPENPNLQYVFSVDDPAVAQVENGVLTAVGAGTTTVTVTVLPTGDSFTLQVQVTAAPVPERPRQPSVLPEEEAPAETEPEQPAQPEESPAPQPELPAQSTLPETGALPFTDVSPADWYYGAVQYAWDAGMMNGMTDTLFQPAGQITRAMIVTMLWRLEGCPGSLASGVFDDVPEGMWYTDAINWAAAFGVVTGYDADTFGPDDPITRQQLAAILYRYETLKHGQPAPSAPVTFTDADSIAPYAREAVAWCAARGIVKGRTDGSFDPEGTATRAEAAAMMQRYLEG